MLRTRIPPAMTLVSLLALSVALPAFAQQEQEATDKPGEGIWRNYDFTPGTKVWFASDFTDEPVGRFPASQLEFVRGNMEIVEMNGEKVLEVASASEFKVNLPEQLPEDFTLEFVLKTGAPNMATFVMFTPRQGAWNRYESQYLHIYQRPGIAYQSQPVANIVGVRRLTDELTPIKLQVDGDYAILYVGTERAANIPNAKFITSDAIYFTVNGNARLRTYLRDIVVAVGVEDMYDGLMEAGEFTARMYFAFNDTALLPESTPVLEEIRSMLENHPELEKIIIEGHTDSVGDEDYNQRLSEGRAGSVKTYLVDNGIDAGRIETVGKGESEPVADNGTAAGRAENRRVVIRLPQE